MAANEITQAQRERLLFVAQRADEFATIDYLGMTVTVDWVGARGEQVEQVFTVNDLFERLAGMIRDALEPGDNKVQLP
jgi:hypothetical protein